MATVQSNVVTPQQSALNNVKAPNPLAGLFNPFSSIMSQSTPSVITPKASGAVTAPAATTAATQPALKTKVTETYHAPAAPAAPQNTAAAAPTYPWQTPEQQSNTSNGAQGLIPLQPQPSAFNQATTGLIAAPGQNADIAKRARDIAADYGKKIADVGGQGARFEAGQRTTGTSPVAEGNAAITAQTTAAQQAALAAGESAELQGIDKELTAQNQGQNALGTAGNLASPQLGQFGQAYYDPTTGKTTDAGSQAALNPVANIQSIAQQVANGQISPSQGYALGGSVANFQGALNQAILAINPNFNQASAQAAYDTRQQNSVTAGTTPTNAAAAAYAANYNPALQIGAQLSNVEGLGSLLLKTASGGQINPLDVSLGNQTLAQFKRNLSSADQARFDSTLAAFSGAASLLLSSASGQIPTDVSNNIAKIANGSLGLDALRAMVDQAKKEGAVKLTTANTLVNTPGSSIGAPSFGGGSGNNQNPLGI